MLNHFPALGPTRAAHLARINPRRAQGPELGVLSVGERLEGGERGSVATTCRATQLPAPTIFTGPDDG